MRNVLSPEETRKHVLVCDDDADIVFLIKTTLTLAGFDVTTACGHREFQEKFDPATPPNLILMDVRMPEQDGFTIAEGLGSGVRVPIIFVTAHDRPVYRLYAPIAGGVDYVTKPFDPDDLVCRVKKAMTTDPRSSNSFLQRVVCKH